ncbi:MAG: universal stress protein [Acidimicrobiia bacterium]
MATIVVGVDGSQNSHAALRWALEEANLRKVSVEAIAAWTPPALAFPMPETGAPLYVDDEVIEATKKMLEDAVAEAHQEGDAAGVAVEAKVVRGAPGQVLLEASKSADLLVVGARGHGGFAELLLGSVSSQCVHHASCPVVVVRA